MGSVTPARTYWHLADIEGTPSDYEIATSRLLYYVNRGFEVAVPLADWYRTHQTGSALACDDWERFRDPRQTTYADYVARRAASPEGAHASGSALGPLAPALHLFHGLQMLSAYVGQMAPSGRLTIVAALQAADEMRAVERLARGLASLRAAQPELGADARQRWQTHPAWQPARRLVETMLVTYDWAQAFTALNLCAKPALDAFFWEQLGDAALADDAGWHRAWSEALVSVALEASPANRETLAAWVARWNAPVGEAMAALGALAGPAGEGTARAAIEQAHAWQRRIGVVLMIRALEQQLRETESRFRNMADASPVLLWMAGPDGLCTFFNQTWLDFTGRTLEDEWGVGWAEGVYFEDFQRCMDTYADAFNRREVFEMEYRLRRKDGVFRWVLDRGTPRYAPDGTFAGYIGSCVDMTERKELELELREAVRVRDDFLSIASHELRTPLTALKLRAQHMVQTAHRYLDPGEPVGQRLQRDAVVNLAQVQRLTEMVNLLLDASRIAEGALRLERQEVEAGALVAAVAERMKEPAASAGSVLRLDRGDPAGGCWDSFRIEQVVTNLIANAIKYGAGKPIDVTVGRAGVSARITVRDQGPGIAPDDQRRLFERFARFGSVRHYGGFGLGLWIARSIVEAHGGMISVESRPGAGAGFTVELPAR